MPDPKTLEVGDRVRFVALPDEWQTPGITLPGEDVAFMKAMVARTWPSRVYWIDGKRDPLDKSAPQEEGQNRVP